MPTYSPPTKTVGDVMNDVKRTFGDESGIVLEEDDIVRWINTAAEEIVDRNYVLKARADLSTVSGQQEYPIQQLNIAEIDSVIIDNVAIQNVSFQQAQELLYDGRTPDEGGNPQIWWIFEGQLVFWPVPQGVNRITIFYSAKPRQVTNDPALPLALPDKYYPRIVEHVLRSAYEMDEDWQAAQAKQAQYDAGINRMGQEERDAASAAYPFTTSLEW